MIYKLLIIYLLIVQNEGKRILGFFPLEGKSQHNIFAAILYGLAKQGHEVVYLTPVKPDLSHPNLDVSQTTHPIIDWKTPLSDSMSFTERLYNSYITFSTAMSGYYHLWRMQGVMDKYFNYSGWESRPPLNTLVGNRSLILINRDIALDYPYPLPPHVKEVGGVNILPNKPLPKVSQTTHPIIDWKTPLSDSMSFTERLYNSYITFSTAMSGYYHLWRMQGVMDKYFNYSGWESRPPLNTLVGNRSLILINRDIALDYPYPLPPHVKEVGGVNILPNKPLPKDLKDFMDASKEGVIYFSMGSHLNTSELMTSEIGKAFMPVFQRLTQKVLIKWESDEKIDLPSNIKTYKWVPQHGVLGILKETLTISVYVPTHKNCVLFITHGGLLSLTEAVYHGVPVVGIPHFADQPKNIIHVVTYGYGVQLTLDNVTQSSASWAVQEVLNNPRYKEEITKRSKLLRDKRHTAVEEAVYWVEYAIKYPNVLTPKGAYLNFFQLHMIDITLFWLFFIVITYKLVKKSLLLASTIMTNRKKEKLH